MIELDHLNVALSGTNLIEAGAGSGKTYAITCLYLRLLLEKDLLPEQILVVTFTEAATKELRARIRSRIRETLETINGVPTHDAFINGLIQNLSIANPGLESAREKLTRALYAFDTAAIFTIHGFCLRALMENALESGSLYDTELITDQQKILQEIVDDFWRREFFDESSLLPALALQKKYSPDKLMSFIKGMMFHSRLNIIPRFSAREVQLITQSCRHSFADVRKTWARQGREIKDIIITDKGLSRDAKSYKTELLHDLFAAMDSYAAGDDPFAVFDGFEKFTSSGIDRGKKKTKAAPVHPFFDSCEKLRKDLDQRWLALLGELIEFCREKLPLSKRRANIRFFDDLLHDLEQALSGAGGGALAGVLHNKYRAALIDEFQDTDPVQYDIFRRIYKGTDYPLFLIGDPKQAIYSFRGADVFAYMQAAANVSPNQRFTLTANWRSTPRLLNAFNAIFGGKSNPFVYEEIAYHPTKPGQKPAENPPAPSAVEPPFQIWCMPGGEDGQPLNVTKANNLIPPAVAAQIYSLLTAQNEEQGLIAGRSLLPGDIAVIVRSHREAGYIQQALSALAIPCVVRSDQSVLASREAEEMALILHALADPGSETKIRAALATVLLGRSGNDIAGLLDQETDWENCLETFRQYHQAWQNRGFMVMAQWLLTREKIRERLLRYADGERRLTNLLHCLEIIHRQEHEQRPGLTSLVAWFSQKVATPERNEEEELRLETDEMAVRIVTVHVSKGLEYPVVFCPFLWGGLKDTGDVITFHENYQMVMDFGSQGYEQNRQTAQKEQLAEDLRLLYVALTRAQYRCYLCAGKISSKQNRPETSAIAYLLHASDETRRSPDPVDRLALEVSALSAEDINAQLHALQEKAPEEFLVTRMPEAGAVVPYVSALDKEEALTCRKFSRVVESDWRVASFTSFTSRAQATGEQPDRDEVHLVDDAVEKDSEATGGTSIFHFPKGAQAGIFFHEIFEKLDFAATTQENICALTEKTLAKYGYESLWQPAVCKMVDNVIHTRLSADQDAFDLASIRPGSWITELEFYFPLRLINSGALSACLQKWGVQDHATDLAAISAALNFQQVQGMVRGFMDMVFEHHGRFYLVDWKSNHLGGRVEDYSPSAMKKEMERHLYPLQYLLYTVALNRYLARRVKNYDYERDFGGALYIFLRGVDAKQGKQLGIFRDKPPGRLIAELTRLLMEKEI